MDISYNLLQFWKKINKYKNMKDNLKSANEKYKIIRLSTIKSKI